MAPLIYLASPFSHINPAVRQHRFEQARRFTIEGLRAGHAIFSPIVYGMDMEKEIGTAFEPWQALNDSMILASEQVWCLCLDGWSDSRGVRHELEFAHELGKHISFFSSWGNRINAGD